MVINIDGRSVCLNQAFFSHGSGTGLCVNTFQRVFFELKSVTRYRVLPKEKNKQMLRF